MTTYEKRETTNDVTLQGGIVHKFSAPKVTILTLVTKNNASVANYPKVVFFGDMKDEADKFEKGDCVKVTGNIQSSKRKPEIKNQVLTSVFAESIESAKSSMEENFDVIGDFVPYKNEFKISGSVVAVDTSAKGIFNITVRTDKNSRPSFVKLTRFVKGKSYLATEVCVGDYVYVLGHVQTHKSDASGETKYFQNYVITEIKK